MVRLTQLQSLYGPARCRLECSFSCGCLSMAGLSANQTFSRKKVLDSPCEVCNLADETPSHLVTKCDFANQFWMKLAIQLLVNGVGTDSEMHLITAPPHAPAKNFSCSLHSVAGCCGSAGMGWSSGMN